MEILEGEVDQTVAERARTKAAKMDLAFEIRVSPKVYGT